MSLDLSGLSDSDLKAAYSQSLAGLSDDELKRAYDASSSAIGDKGAGAKTVNKYVSPYDDKYLAGLDNDTKVNDYLGSVPAADKEAARNDWARAYIANSRSSGGLGQRLSDTVSRVSRAVPGVGSYLDEADAGLHSLMGEDYDNALAIARARDSAVDNTETQKLLSTPFGDIHEGGLERAAGAIGGAIVAPTARFMGGTGFAPNALNTAANAGGYAALDAFGQGEGADDRVSRAIPAGLEGAALGGVLGGTVGKYLDRISPASQAAAANTERGQAVQAAEYLRSTGSPGQQALPEFLANSDNKGMRSLAGAVENMPSLSAPMRRAASQTLDDLGANTRDVAEQFANQGTGAARNLTDTAAATEAGGQSVGDAIRNWIGPTSRAETSGNYNAVYSQLAPGNVDLQGMRNTLQSQMNKAQAAGLDIGNALFQRVGDAVTRPGGMSVDGLKTLISDMSKDANWTNIPEYTKLADYIKPLIAAGKSDLRNGIDQLGGPAVLAQYDAAVARHAEIANDRSMLQKVVGKARESDMPGAFTNSRVVDNIRALAMTGNRMDEQQLLRVSNSVRASSTPEAMNDFRAAIVRRMGEGGPAAGTPGAVKWSADRFGTEYGKYSENGKSALFGPRGTTQRDALDAINTISDRFKTMRQFENPSGTAHSAAWFELGLFALDAHWLEPISQLFGTEALGRLLARPATAQSVSRFGNAISNFAAGNASKPAVRLATLNLARAVADETGSSEKDAEAKLTRALPAAGGQNVR